MVDERLPIAVVLTHYGADDVPDWGFNRPMRCPFHDDQHKSATINVEKQLFYCHTCGVRGDVFGVIMTHEGVTFPEAVRRAEAIAVESGVEVRSERRAGNFISSGPWHKRGNSKRNGSRRRSRSRTWS